MKHLTIYIISFNYNKVYEVYLKPLFNLMESSPRFHQITHQDRVKTVQEELGMDRIVFSKATTVGHLTLASGLQLNTGNDDALAIIGADILQVYLSEISFFIENAGASEESIFRLYSDSVERIKATVGNQYLAFAYLDTSANNAESIIENYILKNLSKQANVFFRARKRWEARPELFPEYKRTGETFKVIVGDGMTSPRLILTEEDQKLLEGVAPDLIEDVPIDSLEDFQRNLSKSIKDIIGRPTLSESKFISNPQIIEDMWIKELANIESALIADSAEVPTRLIWNQIRDKFFLSYDGSNYIIKRANKELRFIGIDIAHSSRGDVYGFTMLHKEWSTALNDTVYVVDFSFVFRPGENGINLEAVNQFILDLNRLGKVYIYIVSMDTFQSESTFQALSREGLNVVKYSVDTTIDAYMLLYSNLLTGTLKSGRNIFLKNNLLSLYRTRVKKKEKIDHSLGSTENKYNGDWEKSKCGINAKDASDSLCQALYHAKRYEYIPSTVFEKENEKFMSESQYNTLDQHIAKENLRGVGNNSLMINTNNSGNLIEAYKSLHRISSHTTTN